MIESESITLRAQEPVGTIAVPSRDHMAIQTTLSFINLCMALGQFGGGGVDIHVVTGAVLPWQRNAAVQTMRGDWLLFVDDDMVFSPQDVARLLSDMENGMDMVGGLCFRRGAPHEATMYRKTEDGYVSMDLPERGTVCEVDATGMAFVLIHRRVFEKVAESKGTRFGSLEERSESKPVEFYRWEGGLGEDMRFCEDVRAAGIPIFVDTAVEIGHVSEVVLSRSSLGR